MATSTVLVLHRDSLLAQGIERLLRRVPDLEVVALDLDGPDTLTNMGSLKPVAIIVDKADLEGQGAELITKLLNLSPVTKVMCLSSSGDGAAVYQVRQMSIKDLKGLLAVIEQDKAGQEAG